VQFRRIARSWLVWLALLLPIAQAMAGAHALSHLDGSRRDDGVSHLVHCDLCLTAADLGSAAPADGAGPPPACDAAGAVAIAPPATGAARDAAWHPPARAPPASA
jgi:hypothetical protein